jgi:hypothetical protein
MVRIYGDMMPYETSPDVLARLATIESMLGIGAAPQGTTSTVSMAPDESEDDPSLSGLWEAAANLKRFTSPYNVKIWSHAVVVQLWIS